MPKSTKTKPTQRKTLTVPKHFNLKLADDVLEATNQHFKRVQFKNASCGVNALLRLALGLVEPSAKLAVTTFEQVAYEVKISDAKVRVTDAVQPIPSHNNKSKKP